jgi:molecular chaperone DnaK
MYENMQQAQNAGAGPAPDMGNMGGGSADSGSSSDDSGPDVVDADYREV